MFHEFKPANVRCILSKSLMSTTLKPRVVVNVVSPIEGRKFDLTSWGLDVELKK